ncbi:MAG: glyoxalase [Chitinophagaceae bacterium]|nr:glyoxalase [Chitinophagaceae bacterium]
MHIEHLAIWVKDLELMKGFYCRYFNATSNEKYMNPTKQFQSYFLSFTEGPRLELMQMPTVPDTKDDIYQQFTGLVHFAFSLGSKERVDEMTDRFKADGFEVLDGPRTTGDGYYESVVLDPEKNRIELTV